MVHWPEVMFTYDPELHVLFSADAFGSYGALDGGLFDDEVDYDRFLSETYRYYANIIAKYGRQVQNALKKASGLEIKTICSTHGPVWRSHIPIMASTTSSAGTRRSRGRHRLRLYVRLHGRDGRSHHKSSRTTVSSTSVCTTPAWRCVYILADLFRYNGLILGSPTYNMELWPPIASRDKTRYIPGHILATFGSGAWNGAVEYKLSPLAEEFGWQEWQTVITIGKADEKPMKDSGELGRQMAESCPEVIFRRTEAKKIYHYKH